MCCSTNKSNSSHDCNCGNGITPYLWSKKKKLEILSHKLECLKEQEQDIQQAIDELQNN